MIRGTIIFSILLFLSACGASLPSDINTAEQVNIKAENLELVETRLFREEPKIIWLSAKEDNGRRFTEGDKIRYIMMLTRRLKDGSITVPEENTIRYSEFKGDTIVWAWYKCQKYKVLWTYVIEETNPTSDQEVFDSLKTYLKNREYSC